MFDIIIVAILFVLSAVFPTTVTTVAQSDWETCAYYDGWGDPDCVQAAAEGPHKIVTQYEDGSYIDETGYAGCLPEALCDDTV
jgi:hypothetical protein